MAARKDDPRWYFLSGLLLAGAVLSKYFAFLLGFAYLVDVALRRKRRAWAGLAIAYACAVPALALMAKTTSIRTFVPWTTATFSS